MDFHDFWQENKRWLIGVAIGFVVFLIARNFVQNTYDSSGDVRKAAAARAVLRRDEGFYSRAQQQTARETSEKLAQVRARLEKALVFATEDEFVLEGKGDAHLHFDKVSRRVKRDLLTRADALGVELQSKNLDWPAPEGREQIAPMLVGLDLLETAVEHLLDAHEAVRETSLAAGGLESIDFFRIQPSRSGQSQRGGRSRGRRGRRGGEDPADAIGEEQVRFKIAADAETVYRFFEACRREEPRITLASSFKMASGRTPGEPLIVTGTLSAVRLKDKS